MTPENITKRSSENRRSNKPIMEKRRRARINNCLSELKSLILDALKKDPARHSKLEKADILEMTVKHLENLQRQMIAMAIAADPSIMNKYRAGFNECANEVSRFLNKSEGLETQAKQRIMGHLANCLNGVTANGSNSTYNQTAAVVTPVHLEMTGTQSLPTTISVIPQPVTDTLQNIFNGFHLVPTRLSNGDLAFVVPSPNKAVNAQSQTVTSLQTNFECNSKTPQSHINFDSSKVASHLPQLNFECKTTAPQQQVNLECKTATSHSQMTTVCSPSPPQTQTTYDNKSTSPHLHSTFKGNSTTVQSQTNIPCKPTTVQPQTTLDYKPATQIVQPMISTDCKCETFQHKMDFEFTHTTVHQNSTYDCKQISFQEEKSINSKPTSPQPQTKSGYRPVIDEIHMHTETYPTKVNSLCPVSPGTKSAVVSSITTADVKPNVTQNHAPIIVSLTSTPGSVSKTERSARSQVDSSGAWFASHQFSVPETKPRLHVAPISTNIKSVPDKQMWRPW